MAETLPRPPISADVDLRDFDYMPLDVTLLFNSVTWAMADGWAAKAAINLWAHAWHQVPAGSLPDDMLVHCSFAAVPNFESVRDVALRGFVKCSDGKLYHPVICERAKVAWETKIKRRNAGKARWKKQILPEAKLKHSSTKAHAKQEHNLSDAGASVGAMHMQGESLILESNQSKTESRSREANGYDQSADQPFDVSQIDLNELHGKLLKAATKPGDREAYVLDRPGILSCEPILRLMSEGCDLDHDILPAIRQIIRNLKNELRTWDAPFIRQESIANRNKRARHPQSNGLVGEPPASGFDLAMQRQMLAMWLRLGDTQEKRFHAVRCNESCWLQTLGPMPGKPGCLIGRDLLLAAGITPAEDVH